MLMPKLKTALARALLSVGLLDSPGSGQSFFGPQEAQAYDVGTYGEFPETKYNSSALVAPKVLHTTWGPQCEADDDLYYFLAPYGFADYHPGPLILDSKGQMVWADQKFPHTYGFNVQGYNGEPYLTWWSGDDHIRGHGVGSFYMVDSSYKLYKKIGAFHNLPADLHEFKITLDNTGIITSYVRTKHDLRPFGGPEEGYIWDGVFQEFDIESNQLQFEWRATDHFTPADCVDTEDWLGTKDEPWDFYHLNSVDKDNHGNYLVSARYCALNYISGKTGEVLWHLGGMNNSFTDLSNGTATNFAFQHHARWADKYQSITLFDNQANSKYDLGIASRGLKIAVDRKQMTACVLNEFVHPSGRIGISQGSVQSLANGNFLVGWGHTAAITEFHPNGDVACDLQFAALQIGHKSAFKGGAAQSYRVFKHKWVGKPRYDPSVHFEEKSAVYVSWNGATEVKKWRLEGSVDRETWTRVAQLPKHGFETKIEVQTQQYDILRLTALDKEDREIEKWNVFNSGAIHKVDDRPAVTVERGLGAYLEFFVFFALLACTSAVTAATMAWVIRRRRNGPHVLRDPEYAKANQADMDSEATSLTTSLDDSREDHDWQDEEEKIETTQGTFI